LADAQKKLLDSVPELPPQRDTSMAYLESQINISSKRKAKKYLQETKNGSLQYHQAYLVYKFLDTPLSYIIEGMRSKTPEQARVFYKNIARQLHPDKNSHP
jgi:hypothetical protein